jgi:BirA family biotin operon repressor/biotin-[acetyl-CoA-carboxylase] ligase
VILSIYNKKQPGTAVKELSASSITSGLKTDIIGRKVIYHPSLPSTMDGARREIRRGAEEGTVIIAGEQTAGRGRLKRQWIAPPGNVSLSIILYPETKTLPYLVMIASLAASRSIEGTTGTKTQIKWPNDILIDGKKVGGVLIENGVKGNKVSYSIIGIGINITLDATRYDEISDTAISLKNYSDNDDLQINTIKLLLTEFDRLCRLLPTPEVIYQAWRDKIVTLGQKVTATAANRTTSGIAASVDASGALWIREANGALTRIVAGDVTLWD